jgi:hypothetical protein
MCIESSLQSGNFALLSSKLAPLSSHLALQSSDLALLSNILSLQGSDLSSKFTFRHHEKAFQRRK